MANRSQGGSRVVKAVHALKEIVPDPDFEKALEMVAGRSFDCIHFINMLQHLPNPASILSRYGKLLSPDGVILINVPNFNHIKAWRHLLLGEITLRQRYDFEESRLRFTTGNLVKHWLKQSGIKVVKLVYPYGHRYRKQSDLLTGSFNSLLASKIVVVGKRVG